jgi:hypothetical protein
VLVTLAGAATNTPITTWEWVMLSVPSGSSADSGANQDFTDGVSTLQNPQFDMDVPGCYVLQLKAENATGWSEPQSDKEGGQTLCFMRTQKFDLEIPGHQAYRYDPYINGSLLDLETGLADHSTRHDPGGSDAVTTAAPATSGVATASGEGSASSLARSDHTHQSNTAPALITKEAASIGSSGEPSRADHKHDVSTAAPATTGVGTTSGEGSATSVARSDHSHQANTAPADVTKAAAAIGTSGEPARADHKHDASTAAPAAAGLGTTSGEGSATSLARSDHTHQANTAPEDVTKAAAAIGTSTEPARADHKHDASTAAPGTTGVGTTSGEGSATSLARSDHSHQSNTTPAQTTKDTAAIGTSGEPARADHKHDVSTAAAGTATPGDSAAEGSATSLARSDHQHTMAAFGTATGTFCEGDDSRLSDARTPTAHDLGGSEHTADALADINGKVTDYSLGNPVTAQASTPLTLTSSDSGKLYTNEGATAQIVFNLPTAAAGLEFTFVVQDSDGLQVVAASGDTIRIAGSVTVSAGSISTTTIGNTVHLKAINATEWIALSHEGTWTVT